MDLSGLFNNPEDADVLLRLLPDRTADAIDEADAPAEDGAPASSSRKRGRDNPDGEGINGTTSAEPGAEPATDLLSTDPAAMRTLHLHKLILLQSEYFKALIKRWRPAANAAAQSSASSAPMLELLEKVPEGQLDAAVLAIECMYKSAAPARETGNDMLLLHAYHLADRFQIPATCMETIAMALVAGDFQVDNAVDHMGMLQSILTLPDIFGPSDAMMQLRAACSGQLTLKCTDAALSANPLLLHDVRQLLLSVFGDVPAVITCEVRRIMFCRLPRAAVFIWVKEDGLKVSSNNSVPAPVVLVHATLGGRTGLP